MAEYVKLCDQYKMLANGDCKYYEEYFDHDIHCWCYACTNEEKDYRRIKDIPECEHCEE